MVVAHVIFFYYGSPKKRAWLEEYINNELRYRFCPFRKGYHQPLLSDLGFFYDVRIKKEFIPAFLRDAHIDPLVKPRKKSKDYVSGSYQRVIWFFVKIARFFLRLGSAECAPGQAPKHPGVGHGYLIGIIPDKIENGEEVL